MGDRRQGDRRKGDRRRGDRRKGDRRESNKNTITISLKTLIIIIIITVIVLIAGVFGIVKIVQKSYEENYGWNKDEDYIDEDFPNIDEGYDADEIFDNDYIYEDPDADEVLDYDDNAKGLYQNAEGDSEN